MAIEIISEMPEELRPKKTMIPILEGPEPSDSLLVTKEEPLPLDLTGHTLMLNLERAQKFQCAYFLVTNKRPYATVTEDANRIGYKVLCSALKSSVLIDVTDPSKGIKYNGSSVSPVQTGKTEGRRIFMGHDKAGKRYVFIPKDEEEEAKILKEIEETGTIASVDWKANEDVTMGAIRIYD